MLFRSIGRLVNVRCTIGISNAGTGSGAIIAAGLPFTPAVATDGSCHNATTSTSGNVETVGTSMYLNKYDGTSFVAVGSFMASLTYQV